MLHGKFIFTGSASCLDAPAFNADFTPIGPSNGQTLTVQGVQTFNGDGTGTATARATILILPPSFHPDASSADFQFSFTYQVAADGTVTVENDGPVTGTFLSGAPAGQTFTQDKLLFSGEIGDDFQSLTLTTTQPFVEQVVNSGGLRTARVCGRSNFLTRAAR
jgi:hypothetical protein